MKNINLLGIKLQDRPVRESIGLTEKFLREGAVHTILYLTPTILLEAAKDEKVKEWIETAELTVWGDTDILEAAEIATKSRYHEVRENVFLKIFLRKMARNHKSILVLSDTEENAEILKRELIEIQNNITVAGTMEIPDPDQTQDDLINKINMITPDVIMARMPFSLQQKWLEQSRPYLNTGIWIGFPEHLSCTRKKEKPIKKIGNKLLNVLFSRQVSKYKK